MKLFRDVALWSSWRPPEPTPLNNNDEESPKDEGRLARAREIEASIRKSLALYVGTWFFCGLTVISSPDVLLLLSESQIKLPIVDYSLSFFSFSIFSPLLLFILIGHVFLQMEARDKTRFALRYDHNVLYDENPVGVFFSKIVLYASLPLYMFMLVWKSGILGELWLYLFAMTVASLALSFVMYVRRTPALSRAGATFGYLILFLGFSLYVTAAPKIRWLDLSRANLAGSNISGSNLSDADLTDADLSSANLANVRFGSAKIVNTTFAGSDLTNAFFSDPRRNANRTELSNVSFRDATLNGVNFYNVSIKTADFRGSDLTGANFHKATLSKIDFSGADLSGVIEMTQEQLRNACGSETTILPNSNLSLALCAGANVINE
ncbi:pentapeptide repeat-containing protein [Hwanghaeella grinnelliae]|uniref:Pentapeptide repeat-containing protein n=1 Tax=Hwanghaeella grinnelliae TaxID=2500179 RepID=A0A3S2W9D9_9PROT|nr:pentapeptide repeat-containing protein [Hwanghaeella grinnelliae]RVU36467.1 pentapeptide repeat-containing protein [Hwanghaeella grinnelliae]